MWRIIHQETISISEGLRDEAVVEPRVAHSTFSIYLGEVDQGLK